MTKLHYLYLEKPGFPEILSYLNNRYPAIESRMIGTFRYVQLHPNNRYAFSYEFGSILRDASSAFGSLMDRLVKLATPKLSSKQLNFGHYKTLLLNDIPTIPSLTTEVRELDAGVLIPFREIELPQGIPKWWTAYNNLKHSEILNYQDGNLENTLNAVGGLAILGFLLGIFGFRMGSASSLLFNNIGMSYAYSSIDITQKLLFKNKE